MHDLFTKVLAKRDLSRAGDLFAVADAEIVADLTDVVSKVRKEIVLNSKSNHVPVHPSTNSTCLLDVRRHVWPAAAAPSLYTIIIICVNSYF